MPKTLTPPQRQLNTGADLAADNALAKQWQVVLFDDPVNTMDHVVRSLQQIFKHTHPVAERIMLEAHKHGRAIAEVEDQEPAVLHADQLGSSGLTALAEPIE